MEYIEEAHRRGQLAGDGYFTGLDRARLEEITGTAAALLTTSATSALEMAAILADIKSGDEVIMPSFTFVSTANAFVLRGATPVFIDIREDTLNIDEKRIESAITSRTKAIVVVHYAGVACDLDTVIRIAREHNLLIIEDAAQAIHSTYNGRPLGSIGDFGCYSFHETKNITCGEGGALLVNNPDYVERAEIIREKGTNRSRFFRGHIDKYTWVDIGSSYLPGEMAAAFLWAQLQNIEEITGRRMKIWNKYFDGLSDLESSGFLVLPTIPKDCHHNAHLFYALLRDLDQRTEFIQHMRDRGISCVFHYTPLHESKQGLISAITPANLPVTESVSDRLVRFPLWIGMERLQDEIISATKDFFSKRNSRTA